MKISDLQSEADRIVIENPCSLTWTALEGDDKIRFCQSCKKNVYNLSNLSADELAATLAKRKNEGACVLMYRRADGKVVLDNCPGLLKPARNYIRAHLAAALFVLLNALPMVALINLGVEPALAQSARTAGQVNFGYDAGSRMLDLLTGSATVLAFLLGIIIHCKRKRRAMLSRRIMEWFALSFIPVLTFLVGRYLIECCQPGFMGS